METDSKLSDGAAAEIAHLRCALGLAAGELSTYRDTDQHPQVQFDRLMAEALKIRQTDAVAAP